MMADEQVVFPSTLKTLSAASVRPSWYSPSSPPIRNYVVIYNIVVDTQIA